MRHQTKHITKVVVHHSASNPETTGLQDIYEWHVDENGWDAIGYHFVITSHGLVEYTRPMMYQGAHAKGSNNGSLGICVVGDNTKETQRWDRVQVTALLELWSHLRRVYSNLDVMGHRDLSDGTECPGLDIRPMLLGPRY